MLDSLKQHYFIDRDGIMFRHILNFMRNSKLLISEQFRDLDLLLEEARFFEIFRESIKMKFKWNISLITFFPAMVRQLEEMKRERLIKEERSTGGSPSPTPSPAQHHVSASNNSSRHLHLNNNNSISHKRSLHNQNIPPTSSNIEVYEVVALHISPDLGERIMLSSDRALVDELFPETTQAILESRSGVSWNQLDGRQVIRFPLNGYCKLNSVQVLSRLLNAGFSVEASTGGGVEGQQFSEYLLVRRRNGY